MALRGWLFSFSTVLASASLVLQPASVSDPEVNTYLLPVCFVVCLLGVYPTSFFLKIYELCCQDSFWWYSEGGSFSLMLI